jgi:hypothetical protein
LSLYSTLPILPNPDGWYRKSTQQGRGIIVHIIFRLKNTSER